MKIAILNYITALVREKAEKAARKNMTRADTIDGIMSDIIYTFYWDYEADKPTVNYTLWERAVRNTLDNLA